jgi:regulator of replication initiation timing
MSADEVESIVNAKLSSFSAIFEGLTEMIKTVATENDALRNEVTELKGEFNTFKSAPSNNVTESEKFARVTSTLTARQLHLKNGLNK